jgi:hypothetical protein
VLSWFTPGTATRKSESLGALFDAFLMLTVACLLCAESRAALAESRAAVGVERAADVTTKLTTSEASKRAGLSRCLLSGCGLGVLARQRP